MRMRTRENSAVTMTAVLIVTTMVPARAQEPADPSPNAGMFVYSGGPAKAMRARTQTTLTNFPFPATNAWTDLPAATLSLGVPVGTTDLFTVAFSAECAKFDGGPLYIRVFHRANGIPQLPVEPHDGVQTFCQSSSYSTHKGKWVRRIGAGTHVLQVQFRNPGPAGSIGVIDDWTFELVVYD